jgi:hypothetical protein
MFLQCSIIRPEANVVTDALSRIGVPKAWIVLMCDLDHMAIFLAMLVLHTRRPSFDLVTIV